MSDLDTALRTMFAERALDIEALPRAIVASLNDAAVGADEPDMSRAGTVRRTSPRRTGWLIAAAVAAVLAVAGVSFALARGGRQHGAPPASHVPTPSVTRPVPTPVHIARSVALNWFGMAALPGFTLHERESAPGHRWLAVRLDSDQDTPVGCNGCESASVYVYVYDKGAFDPSAEHVTSWQRVSVNGATGYFGTAKWRDVNQYALPTVVWEYAPGQWALVQGVTPSGERLPTLLTVARAVRPTESVPILLPFSFRYLPDLPIVDVMDDRSEGYAFVMTLGDAAGRTFDITLWNGTGWPYYDPTGMTRTVIDGLAGYLGADQGAGVLYHGGGAAFGFGEGSNPLTPADHQQLTAVVAGLRWANGDGRAPQIPAEQAIP